VEIETDLEKIAEWEEDSNEYDDEDD